MDRSHRITREAEGPTPSGVAASTSPTTIAVSSSSESFSAASAPILPTKHLRTARSSTSFAGHLRDTHVQAVMVASPSGTTNPVPSGRRDAVPGGYARRTTAVEVYGIVSRTLAAL